MKKNLLITIFFIFSFSCVFANPLDDDCAYLEKLFSDVAIDMSLAIEEKGVIPQDLITEIKSIYKNSVSKEMKKKGEIDKRAFASAINETYAKYSITNGHVSVLSGDDFFAPFEHQFINFSNVYFIKENNTYIVSENYKNIKKGMKYTGNIENLFKTIKNNKILYRYGIFSSEIIKNTVISINNKEFKIPVHDDAGSAKYRKDYDFKKINDSVYLKIEKCQFANKTQEKQFLSDSEEIINYFKNTDTIIFDFRNNLGGLSKYLNQFSYALIYDKKATENEIAFNKWYYSLTTGHKRINTRTMIDRTRALDRASANYINYWLENLDTKFLEEPEEEIPVLKPWYTGKIYIMINPLTCSAAEDFSLSLKKLFGNNVKIIGQNSYGCLDFPDTYSYILPASKIQLKLSAVDCRKTNLLNEDCWHGDTLGIFPDYWCEPQDIVSTLSELLQNNKLSNHIKL